jgi:hypothetical protein
VWRRILASILVVLGALLLLFSSFGWWADRYFLNSERFSDHATEIIDQEKVQDALAFAITHQISKQSGRKLSLAEPVIQSIVREIVDSDAFKTIFDAAVLRAHRAVVEGHAREMVLDLSESVDNVRSALRPIAPNLAQKIPAGEKVEVKILSKTQLDTVYDVTNAVKKGVIAITIVSLLFLAGGIALAPRRWRTLALAGWVTLGLFAFSIVAVAVGKPITGSFIAEDTYSDAAQASYKVITRGLLVQGVLFCILGLVVGLVAGWIDRHGGWAAAMDAGKRGGGWVRDQMPKKAVPVPTAAGGDVAAVPVGSGNGDTAVVEEEVSPGAAPTGEPVGAMGGIVASGVLAPRLPEPKRRARSAHWWRAAVLLIIGLFAVFSPGSLTNIVVVLIGLALLYLAITEALAAWASPKEPRVDHDDDVGANSDAVTAVVAADAPPADAPEDEPTDAA